MSERFDLYGKSAVSQGVLLSQTGNPTGIHTPTESLPAPGTFIRVIRQPAEETIYTHTGLCGWITNVWRKGQWAEGHVSHDCVHAMLARHPDPTRDKAAGFPSDANHVTLNPGDFEAIQPTPLLTKMAAAWRAQKAKDDADPQLQASLNDIHEIARKEFGKESPHTIAEKLRKTAPNPFLLLTAITRNNKVDYPTYGEFVRAGLDDKQRKIACLEKLTAEQMRDLGWLSEASNRTTFWSGEKIVRHLVAELDLDPYADRFNGSLYEILGIITVTPEQLRVVVINALNDGKVILDIDDGYISSDGVACCCDRHQKPTCFFVAIGKRRQLPAYPSDPPAK